VSPETEALFEAVLTSRYDGIQLAVRAGANFDQWDANGMTPLLYAVFRGDAHAVDLLLQSGADPNRGHRGDPAATPLWHATDDFGLVEIAVLLRKTGATA
jgi:ankyrin repeat protein